MRIPIILDTEKPEITSILTQSRGETFVSDGQSWQMICHNVAKLYTLIALPKNIEITHGLRPKYFFHHYAIATIP